MKSRSFLRIFAIYALVAGLFQGCVTTHSPETCRTKKHGGAATQLHMCAAQNFLDFRNRDGSLQFHNTIPTKALVRNARGNLGTTAALMLHYKWPNGKAINVGFLNDPLGLKSTVLNVANEWNTRGGANISFVESSLADSEIRITFTGTGYWSLLGTQAKRGGKEATMCLAFQGSPSTRELRRVVLHEFGHAIGLMHEHQQPLSDIKWDAEACYRHFGGPPNCWDRATVDSQILNHRNPSPGIHNSAFDRNSIMAYEVDPALTLDRRGVPGNFNLSSIDREFIASVYPKGAPVTRRAPARPGLFSLN